MGKKGLSTVIATVIMIALVVSSIAIVWGVVRNLVNDNLEGADACINIFDKVSINGRHTCYDPGESNFQFSLSIGDIEVEEVLFAISGEGRTESFSLSNTANTVSGVTNYPDGGDLIILPKKNAGLTYVYNLTSGGFTSGPDSFEIAPTIDGKQCGSTDLLRDIPDCATLL